MEIRTDSNSSRTAVVAVVLFLIFDFAALASNFWLSHQIEKQAIYINLAGRQRMLSQRMVKILLQMERRSPAERAALLDELRLTFDLFDRTLSGFAQGSTTVGGSDQEVLLQPVQGSGARAAVEDAMRLWIPYRSTVQALLERSSAAELREAIKAAESANLGILRSMNTLTTELEVETQKEAAQIRIYQGSAFLLALANFFWAFLAYTRRLREFSKSKDLLDDMMNRVSASVLVLDSGEVVVKANASAETLFGYDPGTLRGIAFSRIMTASEKDPAGIRRDGSTFMAALQRSTSQLEDRLLHVITVMDITSQRMTEEHLSSLAYHDLLTSLPNRLLFNDRLKMEIAHAQRRETGLAVLFVDLDRFKPVNDEHGHHAGDILLQDVAVRLRRCLRESDTVSRRGGDEFTIILTDVSNAEVLHKMARVILSHISRPFHVEGLELHISCSIGISLFPQDGADPALLIQRADEAMYTAKSAGRGTYRFYSTPDPEEPLEA